MGWRDGDDTAGVTQVWWLGGVSTLTARAETKSKRSKSPARAMWQKET